MKPMQTIENGDTAAKIYRKHLSEIFQNTNTVYANGNNIASEFNPDGSAKQRIYFWGNNKNHGQVNPNLIVGHEETKVENKNIKIPFTTEEIYRQNKNYLDNFIPKKEDLNAGVSVSEIPSRINAYAAENGFYVGRRNAKSGDLDSFVFDTSSDLRVDLFKDGTKKQAGSIYLNCRDGKNNSTKFVNVSQSFFNGDKYDMPAIMLKTDRNDAKPNPYNDAFRSLQQQAKSRKKSSDHHFKRYHSALFAQNFIKQHTYQIENGTIPRYVTDKRMTIANKSTPNVGVFLPPSPKELYQYNLQTITETEKSVLNKRLGFDITNPKNKGQQKEVEKTLGKPRNWDIYMDIDYDYYHANRNGALTLPHYNKISDGQFSITSMQMITRTGKGGKMAQADADKGLTPLFDLDKHLSEKPAKAILIGEGISTVDAAKRAFNDDVLPLCTTDAGIMQNSTSDFIQALNVDKDTRMIIVADNDYKANSDKNAGMESAKILGTELVKAGHQVTIIHPIESEVKADMDDVWAKAYEESRNYQKSIDAIVECAETCYENQLDKFEQVGLGDKIANLEDLYSKDAMKSLENRKGNSQTRNTEQEISHENN